MCKLPVSLSARKDSNTCALTAHKARAAVYMLETWGELQEHVQRTASTGLSQSPSKLPVILRTAVRFNELLSRGKAMPPLISHDRR